MAHQSPNDPQSNVPQPNAMIIHKGCMKSNGLAPGQQLITNKIYPRVTYQMIVDGKPVRVNSNQKFCQGDLCNYAFVVGKLSATILTSCLLFLMFFY
uniref:Uncharacterized protein n=1 Tax=Romanomermis culicivorax TaxID=13658 RepID=A0A915HS61_ROMCU